MSKEFTIQFSTISGKHLTGYVIAHDTEELADAIYPCKVENIVSVRMAK